MIFYSNQSAPSDLRMLLIEDALIICNFLCHQVLLKKYYQSRSKMREAKEDILSEVNGIFLLFQYSIINRL